MDLKSIWIMDFLWNGYGFRILKDIDFGIDMDLVSNPSDPLTMWYAELIDCVKIHSLRRF